MAAVPWVIVLVGQGLLWVERELEEDALTVAGPLRVLLRVTLPRSLAAIGAAALWVTLQTATEISVTDVMQVRTYAEEVFTQFTRPEPDSTAPTAEAVLARAVAVSIPAVLLTWALIMAAARRWERSLPPVGTPSGPPLCFPLGWARWPMLAAMLGTVAVLAGVPIASLVWKVGLGGDLPRWTAGIAWSHLAGTLRIRSRMLVDNLALVLTAGVVTAGAGLIVSWLAGEARWFRLGVLSLMAAAWALPGPVIGLGLKHAIALVLSSADWASGVVAAGPGPLQSLRPLAETLRDRVGILLYYGPSPVPVFWACVVRFFPFAVALLWPVVRLLPPELRDAARVDGAGPAQELRHVVWPLTYLACARAAGAVAVLSLGELGAGKLVETPGSTTFAHEIFNQMHYGVTNDVAAHCLVLLAAVAAGGVAVAVFGRLLGKTRDEG
jgi:iron(III) transport system permease protein